ncbi:ion channel [Anoxybacillus kestanbolensis]|uniref:ion channel n=1 Tax=Anoxybacillus kestanbolensis TaxID=227476 RepID=UPI001CF7B1C7|nr:ion channel [Anoxybacillus kestanbolensis]
MSSSRSIVVSVVAMMVAIIAGTVGSMFSEQLSFFDALWLTVVTILTVGMLFHKHFMENCLPSSLFQSASASSHTRQRWSFL